MYRAKTITLPYHQFFDKPINVPLVFMSVLLITLMMEAVKNNRNIGQFI
jgi:hypothetical protein